VIGVDCNQMSKENAFVLTKCFHYREQFKFRNSVSRLRVGKLSGIKCEWLVLLCNDGSNLILGGVGVNFKWNFEVWVSEDNLASERIFE
jgi:hypothetical protein